MREITISVIFLWGTVLLCNGPHAQEDTQHEMRSLDEQVQEVKTDVLTIARDLALLEERLLYPSGTQLSVFIEMQAGEGFRLDAVSIEIDGNAAARHIYSFKELEALQNGGVQRIHTGNVETGAHDITVTVSGKLANGDDFSSSETFPFSKDIDPKQLAVRLAGGSRGASINLSDR